MRNMKRRTQADTDAGDKVEGLRPRTTVFLPDALEFNLDLAALRTGRPKSEIIRDALAMYLETEFQQKPYLKPEIELKYATAT